MRSQHAVDGGHGQEASYAGDDPGVALLRIVGVQHATDGTPDQVTFDVVVWVPKHKT